MKAESRDIFLSIGILIFAVSAFLYSNNFSNNEFYGPDFFPKIITISMMILGGHMLVKSLLTLKNSKESFKFNQQTALKILLFILLMAGYFLLFFIVGFIISSIIFLLFAQWIFGVKNKLTIIIVSVLVPIGLYLFFTQLFNIPIP